MQIDLASLRPGEIAALTGALAVIGAFIGFVSSLTVAFVNAWAARRNAAAAEQRQYRLKRLSPLLDFATTRMADSTRLNVLVANKKWDEASGLLEQMDQTSWLQLSSALGMVTSDSYLESFASHFIETEQTCRTAARALFAEDAGRIELEAFRDARHKMAMAADLLHDQAELIIFNTRRWRRRYWKTRKWIQRQFNHDNSGNDASAQR